MGYSYVSVPLMDELSKLLGRNVACSDTPFVVKAMTILVCGMLFQILLALVLRYYDPGS